MPVAQRGKPQSEKTLLLLKVWHNRPRLCGFEAFVFLLRMDFLSPRLKNLTQFRLSPLSW